MKSEWESGQWHCIVIMNLNWPQIYLALFFWNMKMKSERWQTIVPYCNVMNLNCPPRHCAQILSFEKLNWNILTCHLLSLAIQGLISFNVLKLLDFYFASPLIFSCQDELIRRLSMCGVKVLVWENGEGSIVEGRGWL